MMNNYQKSVLNKAYRKCKKQGIPFSPFLQRFSGKFHGDVAFIIWDCKDTYNTYINDYDYD